MPKNIYVGYRLVAAAGIEKLMPDFQAPPTYKDPDKIKANIEEQKQKYLDEAAQQPYTGTFDEVALCLAAGEESRVFVRPDPADTTKLPISVQVRNFLMKTFEKEKPWDQDAIAEREGQPAVIFWGFEPRLFLKMLGLECSLPQYNSTGKDRRCPPHLWYANQDHRDVGTAIVPTEFRRLTLPVALKARAPTEPKEIHDKWLKDLEGWPGPGVNPSLDVRFTIEIVAQLGLSNYDPNPRKPKGKAKPAAKASAE